MWADRINLQNAGNNGGVGETNHRKGDKPLGGNVATFDGAVTWQPFSSNSATDTTYVVNGGAVGQHIAIPANAIFLRTDEAGNVSTDRQYNDNVIWGRSYVTLDDIR